jgi:hypothetical protein
MLVSGRDQIADQPPVDFPDAASYYATAYRKAGLGFQAIRLEIGDDAFFTALRSFADAYRFDMVTPDDLRVMFEDHTGSLSPVSGYSGSKWTAAESNSRSTRQRRHRSPAHLRRHHRLGRLGTGRPSRHPKLTRQHRPLSRPPW